MLNGMGAKISGAGTHTIEIEGVESLHGVTHRIIPDRIEAGTFAIAAAVTGGNVELEQAIPEHNEALIAKLRAAGVSVEACEAAYAYLAAARCAPRASRHSPIPAWQPICRHSSLSY